MNTRSVLSNIELATKMQILSFQSYTLLTLQSVKDIFTTTRYAGDVIVQMDQIGVGSLLIVIVALVCVGGVVVLNSSSQFSRFGATALRATPFRSPSSANSVPCSHRSWWRAGTPPEWLPSWGPWLLRSKWMRCEDSALTHTQADDPPSARRGLASLDRGQGIVRGCLADLR